MSRTTLYWFRNDLRLTDLPAFNAACAAGGSVLACYILDDTAAGQWQRGGASRWWLHHSLNALRQQLRSLGGDLILRRGDTLTELRSLAEETDAESVYCSRAYEPWAVEQENKLHQALEQQGVTLKRYAGALLFEPELIRNQAGLPFKVFTPFWKACLRQLEPTTPATLPDKLRFHSGPVTGIALEELALLPCKPNWAAGWDTIWQPGSQGAAQSLATFISEALRDYNDARDFPGLAGTSRLSAHMHFGELSPRELWHAIRRHTEQHPDLEAQRDKFLSELGWREFNHHLLHHFPTLPESPFKPSFENFPWLGNRQHLAAWQQGRTGYPIVDAGMRELWQTGYMQNRVRMVTASFLTKHLLLPWQLGAHWFWDTLVDADLANNTGGWQWVAGSGADAAPYFRIFNPTRQGEKFDADGAYIRHWVPELAGLPNKFIHSPSLAPAQTLASAGVVLGTSYPEPIVEHSVARSAALEAYNAVRLAS